MIRSAIAAATLVAAFSLSAEAQIGQNRSVSSIVTPRGFAQNVQTTGPLTTRNSTQINRPLSSTNINSVVGNGGRVGAFNAQTVTPFGSSNSQGIGGPNRSLTRGQVSSPLGGSTTVTNFNGVVNNAQKTTTVLPNGRRITSFNRN